MQDFQNAENDERSAEAALANAILTAQSTLANAQAAQVGARRRPPATAPTWRSAPRCPPNAPDGVTDAARPTPSSKRSVSEGQMLKEGDAVMRAGDREPAAALDERPRAHSAPRSSSARRCGSRSPSHPDTTFEGKVARINPSVDPVSRTFQVEAVVPNDRGLLRPGGFAKASILTDRNSRGDWSSRSSRSSSSPA